MLLSVLQIIVRPVSEKHKHFSISVDIYKEQSRSGIQPALLLTPRNATIPLTLTGISKDDLADHVHSKHGLYHQVPR